MTEIAAFPLPFRAGRKLAVAPIRTLRELEMMYLSAVIRAKSAWQVKMNDADVVAKWTRGAAEYGLTEAQIPIRAGGTGLLRRAPGRADRHRGVLCRRGVAVGRTDRR